MADRELWYASSGPLLYDDEEVATDWYPAPYDTYPLRAALCSQIIVTDVPVYNEEVARRMDIDGTPNTLLKAGADELPTDSAVSEDGTDVIVAERNVNPSENLSKTLGTTLKAWLEAHIGELHLIPKESSSGPEGTVFYESDDNHVCVATE